MLKIRNLILSDIEAATDLQRRVYPAIPPFRPDQYRSLLSNFPQGQFIAELDGLVVGLAISLVILWEDYSLHHTWVTVTANGTFDTQDMSGRTSTAPRSASTRISAATASVTRSTTRAGNCAGP